MPPLTALLLTDGRQGHVSLAEGLLAAMARRRPIETVRVHVRRPRWLPARALSAIWNGGLAPEHVLRRLYGIDPATLPQAGVVVSAGGDTLAANAAAARLLAVPNLFYGSLRRYRPEDFSLVLTSYARNANLPNHVMALKPSRFDADRLPVARLEAGAPRTVGLLVGGDAGRAFRYTAGDWDGLLAFIDTLSRFDGTRWIASNSRRTPDAVSDRLAGLAEAGGPITRFIDVRRASAGSLEELFAAAEVLAVTSDSSSMVSEGVWVRRPVVVLAPCSGILTPDESGYRAWLAENGWTRTVSIEGLTAERFTVACSEITPLAFNPLDHLAAILAERLPQLLAKG